MIRKEIIDLIASRTLISHRDLIEKDLILHRLLLNLSSNEHFSRNYAFKGGTCIMKCYLNYYRFSEDLDFTYLNQEEFKNKSGKRIRETLSLEIDTIIKILTELSEAVGLTFKPDKRDINYVEHGGSNKQATFKVWYIPDGAKKPTFIKIQINFVEELEYPTIRKEADNVIFGKQDGFKSAFLLPENSEWLLKTPKLKCYDIKEILIEKVRAILTRKGTKARDYIDVYMIQKHENLEVKDFREQILRKVRSALANEKYKLNLNERQGSDFSVNRAEEQRILLVPLPKDFDTFINELNPFLKELVEETGQQTK